MCQVQILRQVCVVVVTYENGYEDMSRFFYFLRALLFRISEMSRILALRCAYAKTLRDVRRRVRGRKVRVLFPVNEISKWKLQSVYDLMACSEKFEPIIALTLADVDWRKSSAEQEEKMEVNEDFFLRRGMQIALAYDVRLRTVKRYSEFGADIVFYNYPWVGVERQMPASCAVSALTCYVPYFVLNYGDSTFDVLQEFHQELWRHFLLTEEWAESYGKRVHFWTHAGRLLGYGHPQLDYYYLRGDKFEDDNIVIYAPHWSINANGLQSMTAYSTFLDNAQTMLDYAKKHQEFKWVFKPHPNLRQILRESNAWTEDRIRDYWAEWEKIGTGCYTSDYPELFMKSKALITDCGSFLPEYFATGKPLIHLISPNRKIKPAPAAKLYFDTFYQVHDEKELLEALHRVLEQGDDYRRNERLAMLERTGLRGNYAAKRIVDYLETELRIA